MGSIIFNTRNTFLVQDVVRVSGHPSFEMSKGKYVTYALSSQPIGSQVAIFYTLAISER